MLILDTEISSIFAEAYQKRVFPGGVVWLDSPKIHFHKAFGHTTYNDPESKFACHAVITDMLYDIASVSKLFTATAILMQAECMGISFDTPIANFLPEFRRAPQNRITLRHLLLHNSGIELTIQSICSEDCNDWLELIARSECFAEPGAVVKYTCTNYFLLARIMEIWSDVPLDQWITRHLLNPLHMTRSTYWPQKYFSLDEIVPTEINVTTNLPWHGVVHDVAARAWQNQIGSVAGNSGLFATAEDLSKFVALWRNEGIVNGQTYFSAALAREALRPQAEEYRNDRGNSHRGLGWQIAAPCFMSSEAPPGSAGHAGFTGSSLFFTPSGKSVIILENRVHPTCSGPDRLMYHRRIAEALFALEEK